MQFVVQKDGAITQTEVVKGVHELLDAEALRTIKSMPNWVPGEKDGEAVKVKMTLPINFKLK